MKRCDTFSAKRKLVISKSLSILKEIYRVNKNKPAVCVLTLSTVVADIQSPPKGGFPSYIFYVDSPARVEHCYYRFLQIPSKKYFLHICLQAGDASGGIHNLTLHFDAGFGDWNQQFWRVLRYDSSIARQIQKKNQNMYFPNIFWGKKYLTGF